jgi:predicted nucleic acid-binding protein
LKVYADTSFIASRYLPQQFSAEVDRRMLLQPSIFLTPFHRAEVNHAIFQQVFRARLTPAQARQSLQDFEEDCTLGIWRQVGQPLTTLDTCTALARRHAATLGVRTLDSMHVAAALELKADCFWTFDDRQRQLAQAEGLLID